MESHDAEFAAAPRPGAAASSLAAALAALQAQIPVITKDDKAEVVKEGRTLYSYSYANLADIHKVVKPLLAEHGFAWMCLPTIRDDGTFVLLYKLTHAPSGEYEVGHYPLPTSGTPQTIGSAITYGRRYCLTAVLDIATDDDDGQAAQNDAGAWHAPANPRTRKAVRSRGDLGDDEWTTEPAPDADEPGSITDAQGKRIHYRFTKLGITDRTDRLAYVMSALDLPELATSSDLSMAQASKLITHLEEDKR
jgi:hypothetical protein